MIIRPATLADLNACLFLAHDCVTDHVWQMKVQEAGSQVTVTFDTVRLPRRMQVVYPRDVEELVEDWQRDEGFLVAEVEGKIVGSVIGGFDGRRGMMYHMAVAQSYRRRGIGTALMKLLEQRLKEKGCIRYYLLVAKDNAEAVRFYQDKGWEIMDLYALGKDLT